MLNQKTKSKAFTIVELLTVISVITLIIGLLVPALNKVNRIAKDMKQKAQFHSITTSLEMFKSENGEYPSSAEGVSGGKTICGAHKLAEALAGRDLQGFDPQSDMDNPDNVSQNAYGLGTKSGYTQQELLEESLDRRKGPYLNTDNLPIFDIAQIYINPGSVLYLGKYDNAGGNAGGNPAPVITDIYRTIRVSVPVGTTATKTVQAGTPVLYYKANIAKKFNDYSSDAKITTESVYNMYDNDEIVALGTIKDSLVKNKIESTDGKKTFYDNITNSVASVSITATNQYMSRPYRPDSYILISAGFDGVYGTNDDITNYEE